MLYIKFKIQDTSKFEDFKILYNHIIKVRQPGFQFDDEGPEFDWDNMTKDEVDVALKELNTYLDEQVEPEKYRCKALFPEYVNSFLKDYLIAEYENFDLDNEPDVVPIFNYLEYGFEVDMNNLKKTNKHMGIVEFSTVNYPFGGMKRFIITLAAYDLKPVTCFDGYNVCEFTWTSQFKYDSIIQSKKNVFQKIKNVFKKGS